MIVLFLGISLTLNIILGIALFIIYKYSIKGIKNKVNDILINNFINDKEIERNWETLWEKGVEDNDN